MKNRIRAPHLVSLCFLLTVAVILLSWLLDAYGITVQHPETGEELHILSLLSPEGIRWGLRHVMDNFTGFLPLWWGVVLAFGLGVAHYSGLLDASLRLFRLLLAKARATLSKQKANGNGAILFPHTEFSSAGIGKLLSRKERRALIGTFAVGIVYVALVLLATFSSRSILRDVSGGLAHSPFLFGLPFLLSFLFGVMGTFYGFTSGTFRTDGDIFRAMARPINRLGIYFVIAFFLAQMVACIRYSGLDQFLWALFS